jgi:hypothetical protein
VTNKFQYRARTAQDLEKRQQQSGSDFIGVVSDRFKTYSNKDGNNYIRCLPPTWDEPEHYGLDIYVHYNVGPENAAVMCLAKMKNTPCAVCDARVKLERAGDQEGADEIKATKRVAMWILDRLEQNKKEEEPLVWICAWTIDRDIVNISQDPRTREVLLIDHPDDGWDVSFIKTGKGRSTKYTGFQLARRPSSVPDNVLDYIQDNPLPNVFLWHTYDEANAIYEGQGGGALPAATGGTRAIETRSGIDYRLVGRGGRDEPERQPRDRHEARRHPDEPQPERTRDAPINERDLPWDKNGDAREGGGADPDRPVRTAERASEPEIRPRGRAQPTADLDPPVASIPVATPTPEPQSGSSSISRLRERFNKK